MDILEINIHSNGNGEWNPAEIFSKCIASTVVSLETPPQYLVVCRTFHGDPSSVPNGVSCCLWRPHNSGFEFSVCHCRETEMSMEGFVIDLLHTSASLWGTGP